MKRCIKVLIPVFGVLVLLLGAIIFNGFKLWKNQPKYCVVSKSCFGINLDTTALETNGANWVVINIRKHGEGAIIGNLEDIHCVWYMNK